MAVVISQWAGPAGSVCFRFCGMELAVLSSGGGIYVERRRRRLVCFGGCGRAGAVCRGSKRECRRGGVVVTALSVYCWPFSAISTVTVPVERAPFCVRHWGKGGWGGESARKGSERQ